MNTRQWLITILVGGVGAVAVASRAPADTLHVPGEFPTIQSAIDAAVDGDEVLVAPGTYVEAIDFLGKAIAVRSSGSWGNTTIDAIGAGDSAVRFVSGEGPEAILDGFTITGGSGDTSLDGLAVGGGILIVDSSPTIGHCHITNNTATIGAGVYVYNGNPSFSSCIVLWNTAVADEVPLESGKGGGMAFLFSSGTLEFCDVGGNDVETLPGGKPGQGGGLYLFGSTITSTWCSVSSNTAEEGAGAWIGVTIGAASTFEDLIVAWNEAEDRGGGMFLFNARPELLSCEIHDNVAIHGAGMFNEQSDPVLIESALYENTAENGHGGGMYNLNSSPVLSSVWFTGNISTGDGAVGGNGGAMLNDTSSPIVTNCLIKHNSASIKGGGVHSYAGAPTFADCTFRWNTAGEKGGGMSTHTGGAMITTCLFTFNSAERGGGLYTSGNNSVAVTDSTFTRNSASFIGGGMIAAGDASVSNCLFIENDASNGGGLVTGGISSPTITECRFIDNEATALSYGSGGGMLVRSGSSPFIMDCLFAANSGLLGGGMSIVDDGRPTVLNTSFAGNSADEGGGGIYNDSSSPTVADCTFTGNSTDLAGGGLLTTGGGSPIVAHCAFTGNSSSYGGAVAATSGGEVIVTNSILWGNSPQEIFSVATPLIVTNSDVQGGFVGLGNIDADPLFLDVDGPDDIIGTEDDIVRLAPGSPCIDAGDNFAVPADTADLDGDGDTAEPLPLDFLGNPRFVDDPATPDTGFGDPPIVDMGAYEFQAVTCPGDSDQDGIIDVLDLLALLAAWGPCAGCDADLNGDDVVDVLDLLTLLAAWGPCA